MNKPHAAALLPLIVLLAQGCDPYRPADFREAVKEATKNVNMQETALESERTILVVVDSERNVFFRKERVGTADETALLKERVQQGIERNRRAAAGEEELRYSTTVFLCAPASFKYEEVAGVIDAIREAGGQPIGLERPDGCAPR